MSSTPFVRTGIWTDYTVDSPTSQRLQTDRWTNFLTNLVGVTLTLASSRVMAVYEVKKRKRRGSGTWSPSTANVQAAIAGGHSHHTYDDERRKREPTPYEGVYIAWRGDSPHPWFNLGVYVTWVVGFLGVIVCGICISFLATNNRIVSDSPYCGIWAVENSTTHDMATSRPYEASNQLRSWEWARYCYTGAKGNNNCNQFITTSIDYKTQDNVECPFEDGLCYGENIAIKFSTGPLKASILGINSPKPFEFMRETIFAPLNMNSSYIRTEETHSGLTYKYYYGPTTQFKDHTIETNHTYYVDGIAAYQIDLLSSLQQPSWQPLPGLVASRDSVTSIMFISNGRIYYPEYSDDPIFPAEDKKHIEGLGNFWMNLKGSAGVLAASDTIRWRDPFEGPQWHDWADPFWPADLPPERERGLVMLRNSLLGTSTKYAISELTAKALDAQAKLVRGYSSLPLHREQWKIEAALIFNTSLAKTQFNTHAIARGDQANFPGYKKLPFVVNGVVDNKALCDRSYVFYGNGYQNVKFGWLLAILIISLVVIIYAIPLPNGKSEYLLEPVWHELRNSNVGTHIAGVLSEGTQKLGEWWSESLWPSITDRYHNLQDSMAGGWGRLQADLDELRIALGFGRVHI